MIAFLVTLAIVAVVLLILTRLGFWEKSGDLREDAGLRRFWRRQYDHEGGLAAHLRAILQPAKRRQSLGVVEELSDMIVIRGPTEHGEIRRRRFLLTSASEVDPEIAVGTFVLVEHLGNRALRVVRG